MSLSVGTLNLKFMQRAAAKSGVPSATGLPRGVIPAEEEAKWVLPSRSRRQLAPGITGGGTASVSSDPAIWNGRAVGTEAGPSRVGGLQVRYEASYVPFLFADDGTPGEERSSGGTRESRIGDGGGGRIRFGGFGEGEEGDGDGDGETAPEGAGGSDMEGGPAEVAVIRRGKGTLDSARKQSSQSRRRSPSPSSSTPKPHMTAQGFIRPANYTPSQGSSRKPAYSTKDEPARPTSGQRDSSTPGEAKQLSAADRLRQTINQRSAASPRGSLTPSPDSTASVAKAEVKTNEPTSSDQSLTKGKGKGKKRSLDRGSDQAPSPAKGEVKRLKTDSSPTTESAPKPKPELGSGQAAFVDLDARERSLRAQRKREKKARRKARKAEEEEGEGGEGKGDDSE